MQAKKLSWLLKLGIFPGRFLSCKCMYERQIYIWINAAIHEHSQLYSVFASTLNFQY